MTSLLAILTLGFFLGMRHATDPDHVIAVITLVARHQSTRSAALIGVAWGFGHTLTILVVGAGIILLGWVIPVRVGLSLELSVGLMLILLGLVNLRGAFRAVWEAIPAHPRDPEQTPMGRLDRRLGSIGAYQLIRPLVVGIVHGLAGSAAVALLVLATIRDPGWSVLYLVVFGVGTIVGMMLVTMAIAVPFAYGGGRFARLDWGLRIASGAISVGFGLFLAYQIGMVHGLFGGHPTWTPE